MLAALSTQNKIALGGIAAVFIVFALASALLIPRFRPDFPGRGGLKLFVVVTLALFVAMMAAVELFAKEEEAVAHEGTETSEHASESGTPTDPAQTNPGASARTFRIAGDEFEVRLPVKNLSPGKYTFVFENVGEAPHNLVISGPSVDNYATPVIGPGKKAKLSVGLVSGTYELYCSVPGHEEAGMTTTLRVS